MLRAYDRHHLKGLRATPWRHAENWLLEHQDANGSWGGIQPCYLLSTMALKGLGYRNDHPVIEKALEASARADLGSGRLDALTSPAFRPTGTPRWPPRR